MIKSRSLIKGSLSEMSSSICISFQKIFLLDLRLVYCVSSRILSIGSQVNRRDPTLIRLCRRHAEKMHWSTNSNDTAQLCSTGQKQLQPGLLAVTHGSCQVALSDKFDLPQLNDGVKKKKKKSSKGGSWANMAKGNIHSQAKLIFFSLLSHSLSYMLL